MEGHGSWTPSQDWTPKKGSGTTPPSELRLLPRRLVVRGAVAAEVVGGPQGTPAAAVAVTVAHEDVRPTVQEDAVKELALVRPDVL